MCHGSSSSRAPMNGQTPSPQFCSSTKHICDVTNVSCTCTSYRLETFWRLLWYSGSCGLTIMLSDREQLASPPVREYIASHTLPNERIMEAIFTISKKKGNPLLALWPGTDSSQSWKQVFGSESCSQSDKVSAFWNPFPSGSAAFPCPERNAAVRRRLGGWEPGPAYHSTRLSPGPSPCQCQITPNETGILSLYSLS